MTNKLLLHMSSIVAQPTLEEQLIYDEEIITESPTLMVERLQHLLSTVAQEGKQIVLKLQIAVKETNEGIKSKGKSRLLIDKKHNKESLSEREKEVLKLIMQGYTNSEIAHKLFISFETVKSHRKKILAKCGSRNIAALISDYHRSI